MSVNVASDSDLNLNQLARIVLENLPRFGWMNVGNGYMERVWVDDNEVHHKAVLTPFGNS